MLLNHFDILSKPPTIGEIALAPTRSLSQYFHFSICILKSNSNCVHFIKMLNIFHSVSLTIEFPPLVGGFHPLFPSLTWPLACDTLLAEDHPPTLTCILFLQISPTVNPLPCGQKLLSKSSFTLYYQLF